MPSFNIPGYSQRQSARGPRGPVGPPGPPAPSPTVSVAPQAVQVPAPPPSGGSSNASTLNSQPGSFYLARANHTGANDATLLNGQAGSFYLNLANHTGTLAVANGGTGGTTQSTARDGLGLGTMATQTETAYGALATARTWAAIQTFTPGIVVGTGSATTNVLNHGTYTPTATAVTNTTTVAGVLSRWSRVGSTVTVSGRFTCTPTAAGFTRLRLRLPVASNFANVNQGAGAGVNVSTTAANIFPVWVNVDSTNDTFDIGFNAPNTTAAAVAFSASYTVI